MCQFAIVQEPIFTEAEELTERQYNLGCHLERDVPRQIKGITTN